MRRPPGSVVDSRTLRVPRPATTRRARYQRPRARKPRRPVAPVPVPASSRTLTRPDWRTSVRPVVSSTWTRSGGAPSVAAWAGAAAGDGRDAERSAEARAGPGHRSVRAAVVLLLQRRAVGLARDAGDALFLVLARVVEGMRAECWSPWDACSMSRPRRSRSPRPPRRRPRGRAAPPGRSHSSPATPPMAPGSAARAASFVQRCRRSWSGSRSMPGRYRGDVRVADAARSAAFGRPRGG